MSERPVYLTSAGYEQLQQDLHQLKTVRRQQIAERLHNALTEGELIENAELEDARREQAFIETRVYQLEQQLRRAVIIENDGATTDMVSLGYHVTVQEEGSPTPEKYYMVGSAESSPTEGRISNESPLGQALLGKRVGEQAVVRAPAGDIVFPILAVQ